MTTAYGNTLIQKYLKEEQYISNAREASEMKKFQTAAPLFKKYAAEYGFDYLLLAAQGYQESGLDQKVKSPVGAIGVMQVMPSTAASAPINLPNVTDEDNNIHAGVRMIHFLIDNHFNEPGLDQFNRTLFAIAAYNGWGRRKSPGAGNSRRTWDTFDSNKWFGNRRSRGCQGDPGTRRPSTSGHVLKYYHHFSLGDEDEIKACHTASPYVMRPVCRNVGYASGPNGRLLTVRCVTSPRRLERLETRAKEVAAARPLPHTICFIEPVKYASGEHADVGERQAGVDALRSATGPCSSASAICFAIPRASSSGIEPSLSRSARVRPSIYSITR